MEQEDGHLRFMKLVEVAQETYETAEECLNINYCGMKRVTEPLIPLLLLAKSPRVVNVSSDYGLLNVRNNHKPFIFDANSNGFTKSTFSDISKTSTHIISHF